MLVPCLTVECWSIDQGVSKAVSTSFDDCDAAIWIFAEARSDDEACCASADDDVVVRLADEVFRRHDRLLVSNYDRR